jgi:hypothetical protein
MNDAARKGRRTLLLLAVVFLGPMAVAMALYFTGFQWRPAGTTQNGVLYQPARPMPDAIMTLPGEPVRTAMLRGKWTLIYVGPGACDPTCRQALVEMRQVRRALGRDMDRVQRLYLVTEGSADTGVLAAEHAGLGVIAGDSGVAALTGIIGTGGPGEIFLADPLGNLVMRYPAGTGMKGIHGDLKHLLTISTIG